jgi:hypothetical protein
MMRPSALKPLGALALGLCLCGLVLGRTAFPALAAGRNGDASLRRVSPGFGRGPTVSAALQSLQRSGALTASAYGQYTSQYLAAQRAARKLSGTRGAELQSVLTNVRQIAAAGQFTPSRLPALFLTLERNLQWWTTGPLLSADQRIGFPGSRLVWEHYPGQGIEIQWLATFGEANGYYLSGHANTALQEVLDEALPLATQRAGGIAWEYMFHFDGGAPPWTSGLSQGTALQAFARAGARLKEPAYTEAAKQALGIYQTPPPAGVRVATPAGAHYLEYTFAPHDRILNGYIQAVIGLYDYTKLTGDPLGASLFAAGDAEARLEVPHYDTGAWSMYDQYSESNLNYHELLTEFLEHLCQRTGEGPPTPTAATPAPAPNPAPAPTPAPTPTGGPPNTGGSEGSAGGTSAAASSRASAAYGTGASATGAARPAGAIARAAQASAAIPGDAIYCTTAQRFTADLHTPPAVALLTRTLRGGARAGVQLSLSKIATVSLTVRRGARVVWTNSATVERGRPRLLWITPTQGGVYTVSLRAVDLAGNSATASGTIAVSAAAAHG